MRVNTQYWLDWPGLRRGVQLRLRWGSGTIADQLLPWPPMLSVPEVAANVGVSSLSVSRACTRKRIPSCHRPRGGGFLIPKSVILSLLGCRPQLTLAQQMQESLIGVCRGKTTVIWPVLGLYRAAGLLRTTPAVIHELLQAGVIMGRPRGPRQWNIPTESVVSAIIDDRLVLDPERRPRYGPWSPHWRGEPWNRARQDEG